jgi:pimeloyl-ACP methyl ester carboxylesterase
VSLKSLAGGRVFADVVGEGRPLVVLLHGWRRDRKDLVPVTDDGLPGRLAFLDLPGFGASPPPPSGWGARDYASLVGDCVAELRSNGAEPAPDDLPVVLVGHSFGGRVAVCLAAETPWVSGLVLTGVPLLRRAGRKPTLRFRVLRAVHRRGLVKDATMERYRHRHGSEDYRAAQGVMRDVLVRMVNESYEDELARLRCPTRFVWGEHDTAAPIAMAREAQRLVRAPNEFVTVKDVGHDVHLARPDVVNREIRALCEAIR